MIVNVHITLLTLFTLKVLLVPVWHSAWSIWVLFIRVRALAKINALSQLCKVLRHWKWWHICLQSIQWNLLHLPLTGWLDTHAHCRHPRHAVFIHSVSVNKLDRTTTASSNHYTIIYYIPETYPKTKYSKTQRYVRYYHRNNYISVTLSVRSASHFTKS